MSHQMLGARLFCGLTLCGCSGWFFDELIGWALVTDYRKCDTCAQSSRKLWLTTLRGVNRSLQNKWKISVITVHFLCLYATGNTI